MNRPQSAASGCSPNPLRAGCWACVVPSSPVGNTIPEYMHIYATQAHLKIGPHSTSAGLWSNPQAACAYECHKQHGLRWIALRPQNPRPSPPRSLHNDPARNAILKRPYICVHICKFICTMETCPTLPFDFLNMQSPVASAHMLWTKSSNSMDRPLHYELRYTSGMDIQVIGTRQKGHAGIVQSMVFRQTSLHSVSYGEGVLRTMSIVL